MENAHYFLHVTDTHLCFDAEAPDICCTEQALRSLYQTAFAWDHRPAFVLITGDLVHEGTSADYARAKTLLQELDEQYHTPNMKLGGAEINIFPFQRQQFPHA